MIGWSHWLVSLPLKWSATQSLMSKEILVTLLSSDVVTLQGLDKLSYCIAILAVHPLRGAFLHGHEWT